jgi:Arc/MetJ family transcription regulator
MRTNIVLNDDLIHEAFQYSTAQTKRALIEEALMVFVEVRSAERRRETYRNRLEQLQAKLTNLELREKPSSILKADRQRW